MQATMSSLHPRRRFWLGMSLLIPAILLGLAIISSWMVHADTALAAEAKADRGPGYVVATERQSYFRLDDNGGLIEENGMPIRDERIYQLQRTIDPDTAAVVVMDPWIDMATDHLNEYYAKIAESHVVPLVNKALERGHRVIVLTNDPGVTKYNTKIHPQLAALVDSKRVTLLYHQNLDDDQFAEYLRKDGINTLIYAGFASNMCVIGRRMGMIPMVQQGFKTYFVPEASAAVETEGNWETGRVHRETTAIIAQWIAEIVHYDDFMQAEPVK